MSKLGRGTALVLLFVLCSLVVSAPEVAAEAGTRTVVVPDHYASVQEAVDSAFDGDVVLVKCGTYNGSVVINKAISLIGEDKEKTIILGDWSLNGTVILVQHDEVVVKSFTLKAISNSGRSGRGVHLLHVNYCQVLDCDFVCGIGVWFYGASENTVERNRIDGTGVSWPNSAGVELRCSQRNSIIGNDIREYIYGFGVSLEFSSENFLVGNQLSNNYYGMLIKDSDNNGITDNGVTVSMSVFDVPTETAMRGSYGIMLQSSSNNSVTGNSFLDCPKGVRIVSSSCYNLVESNNVSGSRYVGVELAEDANYNQIITNNIRNNGVGASFVNSSNNIVYHNNFIDNSVLITSRSADEVNFFDNGAEGNYWNRYKDADSDGDGIGDTPYIIDENNQDNHPLMNIIPEFPPWTIIPLFLMATFAGIIAKKKYHKNTKQNLVS